MNSLTYFSCTLGSASVYMERNFRNMNGWPNWPILVWQNRIEPCDVSLIATPIQTKTGESNTSRLKLPKMSTTLFTRDASFFRVQSGYSLALVEEAGDPISRWGYKCMDSVTAAICSGV